MQPLVSQVNGKASRKRQVMKIPPAWQQWLAQQTRQSYYRSLEQFVLQERELYGDQIFPTDSEVFAALQMVGPENLQVVILGQDPYPTRGHAHGLAFSVQPGVRPLPASLRNIFKELTSDLGLPTPLQGSLIPWAQQGVLLLNSVLTVREGQPNAHANQGWEQLTSSIISACSERSTHSLCFVLWGKSAQAKLPLIDEQRHMVIQSAHPSPLSARNGFFGSRPFSKINAWLVAQDLPPIDWLIDGRYLT
jgi:uracil-DNA glycosylase